MIPLWNHQGLIPPIDDSDPTSNVRSPYYTTIGQVVGRFATSLERCLILEGFLNHRGELHRIGVSNGFQWLDGSFTEHIELIEGRAPKDIDVVTFTTIDDQHLDSLGEDFRILGIGVAENHRWVKDNFKVDHYVQSLSDSPDVLVFMASYWYSMWSHRRTKQWKGFLCIDMDKSNDADARMILEARRQEIQNEQN
ncbi:DUF6932 family protein [Pseudomonas luteola]|uniref:DUF6932 family protein n=1 Tax=Pseudomonas luteola TaxID=47886 RepID=UPI00123A5292|nr:hypothetical protein [Pseudomonas luteola]QEU28815.1 hypothetical protein FOB45_13915 [Pseudomonas luteola]